MPQLTIAIPNVDRKAALLAGYVMGERPTVSVDLEDFGDDLAAVIQALDIRYDGTAFFYGSVQEPTAAGIVAAVKTRKLKEDAALPADYAPALRASDYEAFICDNPRCGERLPVPIDAHDMTLSEWRDTPAVAQWMRQHREHAGCTGISLMPNQRHRLDQIDPDAMALRIVQRLSHFDTPEWRKRPDAQRRSAMQVALIELIAEWKRYLLPAE